ncbi:MAG TPA: HAMP domain-containing sensor histidine kinase [Trebonia sp.]
MAERAPAWGVRGVELWWRRRGLRSRVTLTAAAGLLVAFAAADLLLLAGVRAALNNSVDDSARQAAQQVVAMINSQTLPDPVPVAAGTVTIQVLSPAGQIIDVSAGSDRLVPLLSPARAAADAQAGSVTMLNGGPYGLSSLVRIVASSAANGDIVISAVPYSPASSSLTLVERALLIGTPLLFVLFTGAIWLAVGSTLRPIALLRRGAAAVSETGVPEALPVPAARDEVRSLALTLNDMLSRLALARQRQRDLVSDTAHELRSPIASIRTQLEVALDHPRAQAWETTARDVHADTLRLARLAEDLLVLARLDEHADAAAGTGDLAEIATAAVSRYAEARVPVTQAVPVTPCLVTGEAAALDRALVNLIDNAARYAESAVAVRVARTDGWAELTVTDDGPGIPETDLERAFGRFTRLDDARSRDGADDGGAGLGLAIVRATARACGGSARLERVTPAGLRAIVRLPLAPGAS